MHLFFDCEFTDFNRPRPISLGLVSESGEKFYREIADRWKLGQCSLFVVAWVLPLLSSGYTRRKLEQLLGPHLDLIQYWSNGDGQFPDSSRPVLENALEAEEELARHADFLGIRPDPSTLRVRKNPFLKARLKRLKPADLLCGEQATSARQASRDLEQWLADFGECTLFVDSDFDILVLLELFGGILPPGLELALLQQPEAEDIRTRFFQAGGRRHHALDDARALRQVWLEQ